MVSPSTVTLAAVTVIQAERTPPPSITAGPTMVIARLTLTLSKKVHAPRCRVPPVGVALIAPWRLAGQGPGVAVGAGVGTAVGAGVGTAVGAAVGVGGSVGAGIGTGVGVGVGSGVGAGV